MAKRARRRQRESDRQAVAARTRPLEQARRAAATAAEDAQSDRPARVRIDPDSWAAFKDLAAAQRRPVADYLGHLVAAELARAHVAHDDDQPAALAHRARRQLAAALANLDRSLAAEPSDDPR
ncbi:MAG: hypothetical protein M3O90_01925 [Actinomycetota bacterium]|nr:hypothetical protein [Actinomycetota bacterium]